MVDSRHLGHKCVDQDCPTNSGAGDTHKILLLKPKVTKKE